jgi:hypothetical protein
MNPAEFIEGLVPVEKPPGYEPREIYAGLRKKEYTFYRDMVDNTVHLFRKGATISLKAGDPKLSKLTDSIMGGVRTAGGKRLTEPFLWFPIGDHAATVRQWIEGLVN